MTSSRAAELLESLGPNELRQKPPVPLWRRVLQQFQDPLVYLLFVAMGISLAAWIFEGAGGYLNQARRFMAARGWQARTIGQ